MSCCPCTNCTTDCEGTCLACCLESNALTCEQFAKFLRERVHDLTARGDLVDCVALMRAKADALEKEAREDTAEAEEFRENHPA